MKQALRGTGVLVTGANGFIGSRLVLKLLESGARVSALIEPGSRKEWTKKFPELEHHKTLKIFETDLMDLSAVRKTVREARFQKAVHCGAVVNLDRSFEMARACVRVNIEGTLNLLQCLEGRKLDAFIFFSTAEVYGNGPVPFSEEQLLDPTSPYAVSKVAGEGLVRLYSRISGFPAVILRCATSYGPGQNEARLVPWAILACIKGRPVRITSGKQKRDFVYSDDVADAVLKALAAKKAAGETINLGSLKTYSVKEVAEAVKKAAGSGSKIVCGSVPSRHGESSRWSTDAKKAKKLLGWTAETPLEEGLRKTIHWYRERTA